MYVFICLSVKSRMYHTKPSGPETNEIHVKFLGPEYRSLISVGIVIFLCFSLCLHVLQNMSISDCLKMSSAIAFHFLTSSCSVLSAASLFIHYQ